MHSCQLKPPLFTYKRDLKSSGEEGGVLWDLCDEYFVGCSVASAFLSLSCPLGLLHTSAKPARSSLSRGTHRSGFWMFGACGALGNPVKGLVVHVPLSCPQ